uniref:Uncharacterized protein n=1 Tax=Parastrongyloides trichosuri TaxID=131310 RepID=A0A0N4ZY40_PARTI
MNTTKILTDFLLYSEDNFHIGGLTIITIVIVLFTFFLACFCLFCPPIFFRTTDYRYGRCDKESHQQVSNSRRGLLSLMFAKLDEFDSLTPLILSPEGNNLSTSLPQISTTTIDRTSDNTQKSSNNNLLQKIVSSPAALRNIISRSCSSGSNSISNNKNPNYSSSNTINSSDSLMIKKDNNYIPPEEAKHNMVVEFLTAHASSNSPPPIKRNTCGETLIAPLGNFNKNVMCKLLEIIFYHQKISFLVRIHPSNNIILTPESRVTTFDYPTSKSCATIPEDDEECESICGDDLVSIDRTIISNIHTNYHYKYPKYNLSIYGTIPKPAINNNPTPPPSYPPPTPPEKRRIDIETILVNNNKNSKLESPTKKSCISNLSSPQSSIGGSNSIIDDTCSSVSDNSFINHEDNLVIQHNDNNKQQQIIDTTYQLHRIDEVSECLTTGSKTIDSIATMESFNNLTGTNNYINSNGTGYKMPRSVSEQFELGFNNKRLDM